ARPAVLLCLAVGCAAPARALSVNLAPLAAAAPAEPPPDRFTRDRSGSISEDDLRKLLATPIEGDRKARLGVLAVASGYEPDGDLPLTTGPAELSAALEQAGLCELATEMTTDWPADRGISGLRELAARYHVPYLLLYRQRFLDRTWTNGWAWLYPT